MFEVLEKIESIITTKLNIEACYQVAIGELEEYIIYDIYLEQDTSFADDINKENIYYITLNYWHRGKQGLKKYTKIKEAFKNEGFLFDDIETLKSKKENVFGKNYTFKYLKEGV